MSIIITGIDMPECCIDCPIYNGEYGVCNLNPNSRNYYEDENWCDPFEERRKDCPLREYKNDN